VVVASVAAMADNKAVTAATRTAAQTATRELEGAEPTARSGATTTPAAILRLRVASASPRRRTRPETQPTPSAPLTKA
jgi:hypothetical protein